MNSITLVVIIICFLAQLNLLPTDYPTHILCHLSLNFSQSISCHLFCTRFFTEVTEESFLHNINNQKNDLPPISPRHFSDYLSLYTFPKIFLKHKLTRTYHQLNLCHFLPSPTVCKSYLPSQTHYFLSKSVDSI